MHSIELAVQVLCIALEIGVFAFLLRSGSWRAVPVFSAYLGFVLLRTIIGSMALSSPTFYFEFYWISAPLEILLTVVAVLESLWRVFSRFRPMPSSSLVLPAGVIGSMAYSSLAACH